MRETAHLLKALAEPTRLRIAAVLRGRDDLCVCEIVDALRLPQYRVSRHLAVLKAAGVVRDWRQGKWMHYSLSSDLSAADRRVLQAVCERAVRDPAARQDARRLRKHLRPRVDGEVVPCK
jgi:ArsR family transcriptional regulator